MLTIHKATFTSTFVAAAPFISGQVTRGTPIQPTGRSGVGEIPRTSDGVARREHAVVEYAGFASQAT
jgi:hypothetical protein